MTTKKLEKLSKAQEKLADAVAKEYIDDLVKPTKPNRRVIERWLKVAYGLYGMAVPNRVEIVPSPFAALKLATELTGEMQSDLDWCGTGDGGWVSFYDFFNRISTTTNPILPDSEMADVLALRDFGRVAWDSVLLDECAIVIRRPVRILTDDDGNLHSTKGPAIQWVDEECEYAFHGAWIPERMVHSPRSYTRTEYLSISNTEERRALGEINGWAWVADLLGSRIIDSAKDDATQLDYQLLAHDGGKILRKISPPLKNGSQPIYHEPVHEDLKTALAARKWQATSLSVAECERDPALSYTVES